MIENLIEELGSQIEFACSHVVKKILYSCKDEQLYVIGIFTNYAMHAVSLIVNTEEQLGVTVKRYNETVDKKYDITSTANGMRWSYGDWGIQDVSSEHFVKVNETLYEIGKQLEEVDDDKADAYYTLMWDTLFSSFSILNDSELFTEKNRNDVTLLLCGDLPDELIDECVTKINPPAVAEKYLNWEPDA